MPCTVLRPQRGARSSPKDCDSGHRAAGRSQPVLLPPCPPHPPTPPTSHDPRTTSHRNNSPPIGSSTHSGFPSDASRAKPAFLLSPKPRRSTAPRLLEGGAGLVSRPPQPPDSHMRSNPCNKSVCRITHGTSTSPTASGLISLIRRRECGGTAGRGARGRRGQQGMVPGLCWFGGNPSSCLPVNCALFWTIGHVLFSWVF